MFLDEQFFECTICTTAAGRSTTTYNSRDGSLYLFVVFDCIYSR